MALRCLFWNRSFLEKLELKDDHTDEAELNKELDMVCKYSVFLFLFRLYFECLCYCQSLVFEWRTDCCVYITGMRHSFTYMAERKPCLLYLWILFECHVMISVAFYFYVIYHE